MDLLIPLQKTDDDNMELRYALRSFQQHAHVDKLVVVGHDPKWLKGAQHVPYSEHEDPVRNVLGKIRAALAFGLSERFIFSNDDIFLTGYMPEKVFHREDDPTRDPYYHKAQEDTRLLLQKSLQFEYVRDHELHIPCTFECSHMREVLSFMPHKALALRTVYYNIVAPYSTPMLDVKGESKAPQWCFSSGVEGTEEALLRGLFPEPSKWER